MASSDFLICCIRPGIGHLAGGMFFLKLDPPHISNSRFESRRSSEPATDVIYGGHCWRQPTHLAPRDTDKFKGLMVGLTASPSRSVEDPDSAR
jgi:hypothetical protein